jgi:hypothetical protein
MRKRLKTILGFAVFGLAMSALSYAYAAFRNYSKPMNGLDFAATTVSVVLCPAQLLFAMCIDCEAIGSDGFILYSIIGVINMAIYAVVGVFVSLGRGQASLCASKKNERFFTSFRMTSS